MKTCHTASAIHKRPAGNSIVTHFMDYSVRPTHCFPFHSARYITIALSFPPRGTRNTQLRAWLWCLHPALAPAHHGYVVSSISACRQNARDKPKKELTISGRHPVLREAVMDNGRQLASTDGLGEPSARTGGGTAKGIRRSSPVPHARYRREPRGSSFAFPTHLRHEVCFKFCGGPREASLWEKPTRPAGRCRWRSRARRGGRDGKRRHGRPTSTGRG